MINYKTKLIQTKKLKTNNKKLLIYRMRREKPKNYDYQENKRKNRHKNYLKNSKLLLRTNKKSKDYKNYKRKRSKSWRGWSRRSCRRTKKWRGLNFSKRRLRDRILFNKGRKKSRWTSNCRKRRLKDKLGKGTYSYKSRKKEIVKKNNLRCVNFRKMKIW